MDSCYVVDTQSVEVACCENIDFQRNLISNDTNSFPSLNVSVETPLIISLNLKYLWKPPKIDSTKHKSFLSFSSQESLAEVVVMKNEICELRSEMCCLENQIGTGEVLIILISYIFKNMFIKRSKLFLRVRIAVKASYC